MDEARHRDIFKSLKSRFELGATRMPLLLVKIVIIGMESTMVCYIKLVDGLYIQSLNKKSSLTPYFPVPSIVGGVETGSPSSQKGHFFILMCT